MNLEEYVEVDLEVISFEATDVIVASGESVTGVTREDDLPVNMF